MSALGCHVGDRVKLDGRPGVVDRVTVAGTVVVKLSDVTGANLIPVAAASPRLQRDRFVLTDPVKAKELAHAAYVACKASQDCHDETVPDEIHAAAKAATENAWRAYERLVLETEW